MSEQHYYTPRPSVASDRSEVLLALPDLHVRLVTDRGVFSHGAVDAGTRFLLQEAPPVPDGRDVHLLDLGCGYGPVAVTMALRTQHATVWAVDVNERARSLCAENAGAAGVADRVRVVAPHDVPTAQRFAAIRSNPPVRIGKTAQHELVRRWLPQLEVGASAVLVVHRHLGADSLAVWMRAQGWRVERLGSRGGYRLLEVHLPGDAPPVGAS